MTVRNLRKVIGVVLATAASTTVAASASAFDINQLLDHVKDAETLISSARDLEKSFKTLAASEQAKLQAKKDRLKNAAYSFRLVGDALKDGRPLPVYLTKPGGPVINCGDKVYVHNVAQDKVLLSENGQQEKALNFIRVNIGWEYKNAVSGPNMKIECKSKPNGQALLYGDEFTLKLDQRQDLQDGKPYFYPATKAGWDPNVRLGDLAEVKKENAYWSFRGGQGTVQSGIPVEMVASNRGTNGNIGGFCGVGKAGIARTVKFEMHNHCDKFKIGVAIADEGIGKPPQWIKDLKNEMQSLAKELQADIKKAAKK